MAVVMDDFQRKILVEKQFFQSVGKLCFIQMDSHIGKGGIAGFGKGSGKTYAPMALPMVTVDFVRS
ncbi:hypothetical protein IMSAG025_00637 [Muribaculaceae bacterium]|nr:hypothetical protein IMSAG025_00637 [Muribaculaceae bacterium]